MNVMKMIRYISLFFLFIFINIYGQNPRGDLRVMFYNTENLFDTFDDSLKLDEDYLPSGHYNWNQYKYHNKLNNIYKVIAYTGEWSPPDIIGLCEIENKNVLNDLIFQTPLHKYQYDYIQFESPDFRGIDVGCLYNKDKLSVLRAFPVKVSDESKGFKTRDILFISFITKEKDTINVFVNHWPSRRGGKESSENKRMIVSDSLKQYLKNTVNNIIIMGDFNDEPSDKSLLNITSDERFLNLSVNKNNTGTIKHEGSWFIFDQFIVSADLLKQTGNIYTYSNAFRIIEDSFLLTDDNNFSGKKPFRTYNGYNYMNGFSDHLPVYIDLYFK